MTLFVLAYLGGVLTILSPCILPVLPFVFARADRPFLNSGLPMLAGMAATFALIATLAAVAGGWAVAANRFGRDAAMALLSVFGLTLLAPSLAERLARPLVALGQRLSTSADRPGGQLAGSSLLLGVATGLLWAPCAGPILGLVLTGAALHGASVHTSLLLLAYSLGAATSLALALVIGGRVFTTMKKSLRYSEGIRRALGAAVLVAVVAVAFGLDRGLLTQVSLARTNSLEQVLLDRLHLSRAAPGPVPESKTAVASARAPGKAKPGELPFEGALPDLDGAVEWLNSSPLSRATLRGRVVLVDFWTYSCINCLRTLPWVRAWADKYRAAGLVVIGVHAPEFAFEKDVGNVRRAVSQLGIDYPVAIDNDYKIWRSFDNEYWPAHYFADAGGFIRYHHFGEGEYARSEQVIQQLLLEAGKTNVPTGIVAPSGSGALASPDMDNDQSQETYLGYARQEGFASAGGQVRDARKTYDVPTLALNHWGLTGTWTVRAQDALLGSAGGSIQYQFHARDVHLVLGPAPGASAVRFHVLIDGRPPGDDHGSDVAADGSGVLREHRLYQLVRQHGAITDHRIEIRFDAPGVQAFAFTFG